MKILLLKQNVTDMASLQDGMAIATQWCSTINLPLVFSSFVTNNQFTSIPFSNAVNKNGYEVNPTQIFLTAKSFGIPFDADLLVYDWTKVHPQPTNPSDMGMSMQIPIQWYEGASAPGASPGYVFAEFLLHEMCHYYFGLTGKQDITHLMVDGGLQAQYPVLFGQYKQLQPHIYYLYLLKQFMPQLPLVTLQRKADDGHETTGQLTTADTQFGCFTLERPWLNNQPNISCIPKGTYTCNWAYMGDLKEWHYEVMNVPGRSGIFIHELNYVTQTNGCIGVGGLLTGGNLGNSNVVLSAFETKMNKQPFTLNIV